MSDYRFNTEKHHGIDYLHVVIDSNSLEEIAHTYIPLDDIEAAIKRWNNVVPTPEQVSENSNICSVCGGLLTIEYTMVFEQGQPRSMRVEPTPLPTLKFCTGHAVEGSSTRDWDKLSASQKYDVDLLRMRIRDYMIAQTEAFYTQHPELRLSWSMTLDALIREDK